MWVTPPFSAVIGWMLPSLHCWPLLAILLMLASQIWSGVTREQRTKSRLSLRILASSKKRLQGSGDSDESYLLPATSDAIDSFMWIASRSKSNGKPHRA